MHRMLMYQASDLIEQNPGLPEKKLIELFSQDTGVSYKISKLAIRMAHYENKEDKS